MKTNKKLIALIIAVVVLAILLAVMIPMCTNQGREDVNPTTDTTQTQPTEPDTTEPQTTEPQATEPQATEPKPTEPAKKPSSNTQKPKPTEPKPTEPKPTEPKPTEPESIGPEELKEALSKGQDVTLTDDVNLRYVIVPADTDMTLDLNGKTLSVYEIEVQGNGKLLLKNGKVSVDGYVYLGDKKGVMDVKNVDLKHNNNDGNCIRNYGTTTISDSTFTATSTVGGETLLVNWGTMVVNDSKIISTSKPAKPEDFAVYNSGTMTLNRAKVTANAYCVMNVDQKEDDGFTATTTINGGTYTSKKAVAAGTFNSIYVVSGGSNGKIVMKNNVKLVTPVQDAGIRNFGELVGVKDSEYTITIAQ